MSLSNFKILLVAFSAACDAVQLERFQQGEIKRVQTGGPKGHLDTFEKKLFFILYYLKTYPTFDVPGFHFGFSSGHAHNHVENLLPILLRSLSDLGVLPAQSPGSPEELAQHVEQYGDIVIDGLECACVRPQDEELQKARFSGKKRHTLKAVAVKTLHRQILFLFCVFAGSIHDYTLMRKLFDPKLKWFYQVNLWIDPQRRTKSPRPTRNLEFSFRFNAGFPKKAESLPELGFEAALKALEKSMKFG